MLLSLLFFFLVVHLWVKLTEAVWMVDDVLHNTETGFDLSLQSSMHEESHNKTWSHQEEFVWWHNCPSISKHFGKHEGQHSDLNDGQSDCTLEHRLSVILRKLNSNGITASLRPRLDDIWMDHCVDGETIDTVLKDELVLWLADVLKDILILFLLAFLFDSTFLLGALGSLFRLLD